MSIGLLLGGAVTDLGSWRWMLFINVPIGLAVLSLTRRYLDETPRRPGRFDVVGAVTATGGAVVAGLVADRRARARLVLAADGARLRARRRAARRAGAHRTPGRAPDDPARSSFRSRRRVGGLAAIGLVVGGQLSMFFLAVQFIERELGFGPMASGLAFLPLTLGIFGMSRVTPRLVERFGSLPMIVDRLDRPVRQLRLAQHPERRRTATSVGCSARCCSTASRPG